MDEEINEAGKWVLFSLVTLVVVVAVCWALGLFSLIMNRPVSAYREDTRKQTYDHSRQYEQGTNRDIARYCEQMREAKEPGAKKAMAALIRTTVSTYDGDLSDDNKICVDDAKGF